MRLAERQLAAQTLTALGVSESAKTAMLSTTHAPIGKGGTNWITKSKPGNKGQLPAYIQNVRNAIMRDGKDESEATEIAVGRVEGWAEGNGNVSPEVRDAARKAVAELKAMGAASKARTVAKKGVKETTMVYLNQELSADELGDLRVLEAASSDDSGMVYCPADKKKVKPTSDGKCPTCGADLSKAKKISEAVLEAVLTAADRKKLPASAFVFPDTREYPIHDIEHARNALSRSSGKPEESKVKAAVYKRYPALKPK